MSNNRNSATEVARDKLLSSIDSYLSPNSNMSDMTNVQYQLNTRPFAGKRLLSKIVNKLTRPGLVIIKRSFSEYLWRHSLTDTELLRNTTTSLDKISFIEAKVNDLEKRLIVQTSEMLNNKIYEIMKLNDMIKSELMAEINKEVSPLGNNEVVEPKWINDSAKEIKKLNVGSGSHILEGYVNIDHRAIKGVDLVCDLRTMPFEKGSIKEILNSHVAEHFTELHIKDIFTHWYDLLAPDGRIVIIAPDIENMAKKYAAGDISWDSFRKVVLGGQDYNSDYHFNMFSVSYLVDLLENLLPDSQIKVVDSARPNGESLELEIHVIRKVKK